MGLRINQNPMAINAYRNLSVNDAALAKSLEKLSSGFRINRAGDDASGLVKSENLRSEIRGSQQAVRNALDGVSFVQTAEGALNEVHAILQRMYELAISAANTATSDGSAEQAEVVQLRAQLDDIDSDTTFAGNAVFGAALTFHVGAGAGQTIAVATTDVDSTTLGVGAFDLTAAGGPDTAIGLVETAIDTVSTQRGSLGAAQNRLEHTVNNLNVAVENLTASESRIRDTDMALEMAAFTRAQIMTQAATAMLAQANAAPAAVLMLLNQ